MSSPQLVLASTSPYRRELLARLQLPFVTANPAVNEQALPNETPEMLVQRLAVAKAHAVAAHYTNALIIGSDQVACLDGQILGKPGGRERAIAQLTAAAGRAVTFFTGLCVLNTASGQWQQCCESFQVSFRDLTAAEIAAYVALEQPFNCAGSFKAEGLGIALFARLAGDDPNALIGLPLIRLVTLLRQFNYNVLTTERETTGAVCTVNSDHGH